MDKYYENIRKLNELNYEGKYLLDPKYMTKRDLQHVYRYYHMKKKKQNWKRAIFVILFICCFVYIFVDYNLKKKLIQFKNKFDVIERIDAVYNGSQSYFVDTPGCQMPYFDITNDNILQFMFKPAAYKCKKPFTRTADNGAKILLNINTNSEIQKMYNITNMKNIKCSYRELRRKDDDNNEYLDRVNFDFFNTNIIEVKDGIEFVLVECNDSENHIFYKDFHFFIVPKYNVVNTTTPFFNTTTENTTTSETLCNNKRKLYQKADDIRQKPINQTIKNREKVSVMLLGIDSLSHLNFLRQMPNSAAYIHNNLSYIELWGYNKVGDNTYPNLVPVLSGLDENELKVACLSSMKNSYYDKCPLIWKRYKEQGYRTAFAEDVALLSLFNWHRSGFQMQPTDYYLRPIMVEMEKHIGYKKKLNCELCKGGRRTADVVFELIRKLIPLLKEQYFFSFFWSLTLSHDYLNMPMLLDSDLLKLMKSFNSEGIFNKSVVFLLSDHGIRFGSFRRTYQGMMEERLPLLITLFPKWFKDKYPLAIYNFNINSKRLTTPYDLHATLLDLINLSNIEDSRIEKRTREILESEYPPRGISFFLSVPTTRTCEYAGVAAHWCTCHQRQELSTSDARVQRAARFIVKLINERLKAYPQCRVLYLNSIKKAIYASPNLKIVTDLSNDYSVDMTVQLQTKPGLGLFESTVRMSFSSITLTGTISRINLYRSQSYCVDDLSIKMFCYCHR